MNHESVATYSNGSYTNIMKKSGETSGSSVLFNSKIEGRGQLVCLSVDCFLNVIPAACQSRDNLYAFIADERWKLINPLWVQDANSLESYILFEPKGSDDSNRFFVAYVLLPKKNSLLRLQLKQYSVNEQWATKRSQFSPTASLPLGCACHSLDRLVLSHKQFWAMIHHQHCVCEQSLTRGKQLVCFVKGCLLNERKIWWSFSFKLRYKIVTTKVDEGLSRILLFYSCMVIVSPQDDAQPYCIVDTHQIIRRKPYRMHRGGILCQKSLPDVLARY